jgi:hypothetical protein
MGMGEMGGQAPSFGSGAAPGLPSTGARAGAEAPSPGAMAGGPGGGMFGGQSLSAVLEYTGSHGGGTVAVQSQSEAASSIIESAAEVAGIGGFSGKETSVSAAWLREAVESGRIRWVLSDGSGGGIGGLPGDNRQGSTAAVATVTASCQEIPSGEYESDSGDSTGFATGSGGQTLYDCGAID